MDRCGSKRVFGRCTTFNRFAGLGTLHALRTLVFRSRTAWLRRFQGRERDVRDESASVCLGGAGRQCFEAVLPLATDEVRVDVRAPSRSAMFRYGQHVSAVERVFTRHNPLVSKSGRLLSMKSGSRESLNVSVRCGWRPNARQMRLIVL